MKTVRKPNTLFFSIDYNLEFISLPEAINDKTYLELVTNILEKVNENLEFGIVVTVSMGIKIIDNQWVTVMTIHGSSSDSRMEQEEWKESIIIFSKLLFKELKKDSLLMSGSFEQKSVKVHFRESQTFKSFDSEDILS